MSEIQENGVAKKPKPKCFLLFLHYVHRIIVIVGRLFFSFIYKNKHQSIPRVNDPLILESATSLAEKIRTKQIKSEDLVKAYIKRIEEVNPTLNCFVEDRFKEAIEEARKADELIASGDFSEEQLAKDKPLLGVPFTTKDCIAVKGLHHTAGIYMRKDVIADQDAIPVANVRRAGAIPLGLTNVSELCMWWESHNRIHGRTNNPYDTTRIVGGSSGGEGCMQAAVGSAFGIGSDIGGSIRMPAFFNGIFGHKPSKFIVSNEGQFPSPASEYQASFLGVGPMTRHAADLRPLLKIMSNENSSKLKLDEEVNLKDIKVYYQKNNLNSLLVCDVEPAIQKALNNAIQHLNSVCGTQAKELKIKKMIKAQNIWLANMKIKSAPSFSERITGVDSNVGIFIEVVKSMFGQSKNTFVGLMTALFEKGGVQAGSSKHDHFIKLRQELEDEIRGILDNDGVFLYPTHPTGAPYHNEPLIRALNFSYTAIINVLGLPATHIPMGLNSEGLPIGIQVVSNTNNDRLCLKIAEELDKTFGGWIQPPSDKKCT